MIESNQCRSCSKFGTFKYNGQWYCSKCFDFGLANPTANVPNTGRDSSDDGDVSYLTVDGRVLDDSDSGIRFMPVTAHDPVTHFSHCTDHPSGVECIQITRHMGFNIGNVVKYLWRAGLKDSAPTLQDLRKAAWYLNDEIKKMEKGQ